jgi:hypothetical protein
LSGGFAVRPEWADPYRPLFRNGDLQTIAGRYWPPRWDDAGWPSASRLFRTAADVQVLAKINRVGGDRTIVIVHGLTACSEARYVLTLARRALEQGFDVVRLNVRNCGGTEHLAPTLYHSGLTEDLRSVVEQLAPQPLAIVGFSMGGNQALKLAGEWGEDPPGHVAGVCAISAPIRLAECSRRIGERRNRVYELRFLRQLGATLRRKQLLLPERFSQFDAAAADSIWDFDHSVTAKAFGFESAADYYARASAAGYLSKIRLPALLVQAEDDPFIPFETYDDPVFSENEHLTLLTEPRGGHVAFLSTGRRRFWAEEQALHFVSQLRWDRPLARPA